MADMHIAIGLRRKASSHEAVVFAGNLIGIDYLLDKIPQGALVRGFVGRR